MLTVEQFTWFAASRPLSVAVLEKLLIMFLLEATFVTYIAVFDTEGAQVKKVKVCVSSVGPKMPTFALLNILPLKMMVKVAERVIT